MALKRRSKVETAFSMSSMTDIIFLLLIFFMVTSTVVFPNAVKVLLPQSKKQTSASPLTRVTIDKELNYYVAFGNDREKMVIVTQKQGDYSAGKMQRFFCFNLISASLHHTINMTLPFCVHGVN